MTICLNDDVLEKYKVSAEQVLLGLLLRGSNEYKETLATLVSQRRVVEVDGELFITETFSKMLDNIIADSAKKRPKEGRVEELAMKLREVFPEGKKPGGPYYWRGNKSEIVHKLKKFFLLFGDKYTDEQILGAAKSYVSSFTDTSYMKILKYFILKNTIKNGEVEQVSDLLTYIENADEVGIGQDNWTDKYI
jgi:hypothetical protein